MNKYKKLVMELRDCKNKAVFSDYWWDVTWRAADAIEELAMAVERYRNALSVEQQINIEQAQYYADLTRAHHQEIVTALNTTAIPFGNGLDVCPVCSKPSNTLPRNSNADMIRSMTDEQLVNLFICGYYDGPLFCCPCGNGETCEQRSDCETCFREWLRKEADE